MEHFKDKKCSLLRFTQSFNNFTKPVLRYILDIAIWYFSI